MLLLLHIVVFDALLTYIATNGDYAQKYIISQQINNYLPSSRQPSKKTERLLFIPQKSTVNVTKEHINVTYVYIYSLMWCILFCSRPAVSAARLQAAAANSRTQAKMQPATERCGRGSVRGRVCELFYPNVTTLRSGLCYRNSVCLSVVCRLQRWCTLLRGLNFSAKFLHCRVRWPSSDLRAKFYGDSPMGTPPPRALNSRGVSKYSDFGPIEGYIS